MRNVRSNKKQCERYVRLIQKFFSKKGIEYDKKKLKYLRKEFFKRYEVYPMNSSTFFLKKWQTTRFVLRTSTVLTKRRLEGRQVIFAMFKFFSLGLKSGLSFLQTVKTRLKEKNWNLPFPIQRKIKIDSEMLKSFSRSLVKPVEKSVASFETSRKEMEKRIELLKAQIERVKNLEKKVERVNFHQVKHQEKQEEFLSKLTQMTSTLDHLSKKVNSLEKKDAPSRFRKDQFFHEVQILKDQNFQNLEQQKKRIETMEKSLNHFQTKLNFLSQEIEKIEMTQRDSFGGENRFRRKTFEKKIPNRPTKFPETHFRFSLSQGNRQQTEYLPRSEQDVSGMEPKKKEKFWSIYFKIGNGLPKTD